MFIDIASWRLRGQGWFGDSIEHSLTQYLHLCLFFAPLPLCSIPASCHLPLCLPALWSQVLWSLPTLGPSLSPLQFFFKAHCYAVSEQVERCWSTFHRALPDAERWEGLKSGHWGVEAALWSATTHFLSQFIQSCYHWVTVASFSCSDLFACHLFCQFLVFPSFRLFHWTSEGGVLKNSWKLVRWS